MSSRVTAVRSSQPRIGVGTADNMIDLLLRAPPTNRRRRQRGAGFKDVVKRAWKSQTASRARRGVKRAATNVLKDFVQGALDSLEAGSFSEAKRGLKRAASTAISNERQRQTKKLRDMYDK